MNYNDHFRPNQLFESSEAAFQWARKVANGLGFEVSRTSHKQNPGGPKRIYIKCGHGVARRLKLQNATRQRHKTKTKAFGCKFCVQAVQLCTGMWEIITGEEGGFHNHPLMIYPHGYRQTSGLHNAAKKLVHLYRSSNVAPKHILKAVNDSFPE